MHEEYICKIASIEEMEQNWKYLIDIVTECLDFINVNNTKTSQMEFLAYIIEFLFSKSISINDNNEIHFKAYHSPIKDSNRILYKRVLFIKELLAVCPDFFNRDDYTEKFTLFYPSFMQIVRNRAFDISKEDFMDIIDDNNNYIRQIYWDENNYTIE